MPTTIKLKNSVTTTNTPTSLVQGEVAINVTDKKVWVGNAATTPIQLLGDGGSASFTSIAFGAGTVSSPSITFTGDTNTGIYSPAADTIAFTEGGAEAMRIDSSGRVGIGVTPSIGGTKFTVVGGGIQLSGGTTAQEGVRIQRASGVASFTGINNDNNAYNALSFATSATEAMRIDTSGNVGIGTTSPTGKVQITGASGSRALTLNAPTNGPSQTFEVGGTAFADMGSSTAIFGTGSATDFVLGTRSGYPMIFGTSNAERMRITSAGLVQILASSTNSTFTGGGDLAIKNSSSNPYISWHNTAGDRYGYIQANSTSLNMQAESGYLSLGSITGEAMRIISGGNVGIGTTSPANKLVVAGSAPRIVSQDTTNSKIAVLRCGDTVGYVGTESNIPFQIVSNSNTVATFDTSGNVQIGTTTPGYLGNPADLCQIAVNRLPSSGVITNSARSAAFINLDGSSGGSSIQFATAAANNTNPTERMRITSGGSLLVGTTTSSGTSGIGFKVNPFATYFQTSQVGSTTSNSDTTHEMYSTGASAYRFYVGYGGTVYATNTTISAISDQRLKENIVDLDTGLDAVMALKPRKFDWKEGKGKGIKGDRGFIAQEFETVFPDMIEEWKDTPPEGEEPYKAVNANLIPVLVKAIQEQQAMIEELKQEVAALKAK